MDDDMEVIESVTEDEPEDDDLTAQTVLLAMEEAWLNEKFAPEILPHQSDLVDCMFQQITHMEDNMKSYLRARLEKIEKYTVHILAQETKRPREECYLTPAELQFAKEFLANIEVLFRKAVLQYMPGPFQAFEVNKLLVKPNMHAYVFLRANQKIEGIVLPGSLDQEVNFEPGSQHIIQYSAVANLVKSGAVQLI
ncbi:DNA replication complex GINS protein SLD5 isoform X2 [Nomia melanderi]|uniref:DNA replication complex GINS protein SLD5 isoform X2 n=1 Tax=Nomia melanderi TaxID=2448451 RepID=UPI0013043384|nr:DNA replication complex GINS protein SLD5 isoform X2 [Nomia melanderi]